MKNVKKKLINGGIILATFILAVIVFSAIINRGSDKQVSDMSAPSLPQIAFATKEYQVNQISGYTKAMDLQAMRDVITPVYAGKLRVKLLPYENTLTKLKYSIYTRNGEEELVSVEIKNPGEEESLDLSSEGLLEEERIMKIQLYTQAEEPINFYTRLVDGESNRAEECIAYAQSFHEAAITGENSEIVTATISPDYRVDNSSFAHVTAANSYENVSWGDLAPQVEGKVNCVVTEIRANYTCVRLEYRIITAGEETETDLYNVEEFMKVRYSDTGGQLVCYDRTMTQVFDITEPVLSAKGILLGITPSDIPYLATKDGEEVTFVQAGTVWSYSRERDEIARVFSFSDSTNYDPRSSRGNHQIKLLNIDTKGNTTFGVYGYMNRGPHEGEVGAAIYYYNVAKNAVEEKIFITSDQSYGNVALELDKLVYYSEANNAFYVIVGGSLYQVDLEKSEKAKKVLVSGLTEGSYVTSSASRRIAYRNPKDESELIILNLESNDEQRLKSEGEERLIPLGFVNNDFVVGYAKDGDRGKTTLGEELGPMYQVKIVDAKGKEIKEYTQENIYITEALIENNMITLKRVSKTEGGYQSIGEDYIVNNEEQEEAKIIPEYYVTKYKGLQWRLTIDGGIAKKEPELLTPKQLLQGKPFVISFAEEKSEKGKQASYYVYGNGRLKGKYKEAGAAIVAAEGCSGLVVNDRLQYVWERGNRYLSYTITGEEELLEQMRSQLSTDKSPLEALDEIEGYQAINYTGTKISQLLYCINRDRAIVAITGDNSKLIIYGYDEENAQYIEVSSGETKSLPQAAIDQMVIAYLGII